MHWIWADWSALLTSFKRLAPTDHPTNQLLMTNLYWPPLKISLTDHACWPDTLTRLHWPFITDEWPTDDSPFTTPSNQHSLTSPHWPPLLPILANPHWLPLLSSPLWPNLLMSPHWPPLLLSLGEQWTPVFSSSGLSSLWIYTGVFA